MKLLNELTSTVQVPPRLAVDLPLSPRRRRDAHELFAGPTAQNLCSLVPVGVGRGLLLWLSFLTPTHSLTNCLQYARLDDKGVPGFIKEPWCAAMNQVCCCRDIAEMPPRCR